ENLRPAAHEGRESDHRSIGAHIRAKADRVVPGNRRLVVAVIIHGPDFFMAAPGAVGNEINPGARNPLAGAELLQNVIGEVVRDKAGAVGVIGAEIALTEY